MTDKFITDVYIFMLKIIFFGFMRFIGFSYFRSYLASYLGAIFILRKGVFGLLQTTHLPL